MANKKSVETRMQADKAKRSHSRKKVLRFFALGTFLMTILLLLLMLVNWAAIYNTDMSGNEVEISGYNCASAALSDNYTSMDQSAYGDIAVFNYHAAAYVERLSVVSAIALFVLIVHALIAFFGVITNRQGVFNILTIVFAAAEAALFIACHAIAISMNDSGILTTYCNDNPACSVQSQAILPALFAILSLAVPIVAMILSAKIEREVEGESESTEKRIDAPAPKRKFGKKYNR